MAEAVPMPLCRFYLQGACWYAEALNPGRNAAHRCLRLAELMIDWDDFLDRAECFGLSEQAAARIWNGRRHAALTSKTLCAFRLPQEAESGTTETGPVCSYLRDGACLLAMPRCKGRCFAYAARTEPHVD